jgi:DNA-binding protein YbaB
MMAKYAEIPKFGQYVEYVTQQPEKDGYCGVEIHPVEITQHDLASAQVLTTLKADYVYVEVDCKREVKPLTEKELTILVADYKIDAKLTKPIEVIDELAKTAVSVAVFDEVKPKGETKVK